MCSCPNTVKSTVWVLLASVQTHPPCEVVYYHMLHAVCIQNHMLHFLGGALRTWRPPTQQNNDAPDSARLRLLGTYYVCCEHCAASPPQVRGLLRKSGTEPIFSDTGVRANFRITRPL
jgi:hypothetical protein